MSLSCSPNQIEACLEHQRSVLKELGGLNGRITGVETVLKERSERYISDKARAITDHEDLKDLIQRIADKVDGIDATVGKGRVLASVGASILLIVGGVVGWIIDTYISFSKHS